MTTERDSIDVTLPNGASLKTEGPPDVVQRRYEMFIEALLKFSEHGSAANNVAHVSALATNAPTSDAPSETTASAAKAPQGSGTDGPMSRIYSFNEAKQEVSLRILPTGRSRRSEAILLLLFGFKQYAGIDMVPSGQLMEALSKSGSPVDRIDKSINAEHAGLVMKGGHRRGSKYGLNNQGLNKVQEIIGDLLK